MQPVSILLSFSCERGIAMLVGNKSTKPEVLLGSEGQFTPSPLPLPATLTHTPCAPVVLWPFFPSHLPSRPLSCAPLLPTLLRPTLAGRAQLRGGVSCLPRLPCSPHLSRQQDHSRKPPLSL